MSGHKSRILIVEPNEITRKLIAGILASRGFESVEAADGDAAMNLIAGKQPPELVIFDADVGEASVDGFLLKMRASHAGVALVAMSGTEDVAALGRRLGLGNGSVLSKPVVPESLIGKIETHVVKSVVTGLAAGEEARTERPLPHAESRNLVARAAREKAMRRAFDLAQQKSEAGAGGPFAAVVTHGGTIVGEGWDAVLSARDPTARAEIAAISAAARALGTHDLSGCEIFCVCEPCPLGLSAIYAARIDRLFYGRPVQEADALGFDRAYIYTEITAPEHKRALPSKMILQDEARVVFSAFAGMEWKAVY